MDFTIMQDDYFSIEHSYSCALPGYLIVVPQITAESVAELPVAFQDKLGYHLALANRLIQGVIRPPRIYCAQFGEEDAQLHFHVFPRTTELTDRFLSAFPEQKALIHGPLLFDWARTEYRAHPEGVWQTVSPVVMAMRSSLTTS